MSARKATVYIIDDDPSVRGGFKRLIAAHGYDARPFSSAHEFIAAGLPAADACIITDIAMPGMTGFELKTCLDRTGCAAPVIMVTALKDPDVKERARRAGVARIFQKPVDATELTDAIKSALEAASAAPHAPVIAPLGLHILVVDSDSALCSMVCETLRQAGYDAKSASDGWQAKYMVLCAARNHAPVDLMLFDIHLHFVSGDDVLEEFLCLDVCPPILVMGDGRAAEGRKLLRDPHCVSLLRKPFDRPTLKGAVNDALSVLSGRRPVACQTEQVRNATRPVTTI